jgi:hypothetical protein
LRHSFFLENQKNRKVRLSFDPKRKLVSLFIYISSYDACFGRNIF